MALVYGDLLVRVLLRVRPYEKYKVLQNYFTDSGQINVKKQSTEENIKSLSKLCEIS